MVVQSNFIICFTKIFVMPIGFIPKTTSNSEILMIFMRDQEKTIIAKTLLVVNSGINNGLITSRGNFTH